MNQLIRVALAPIGLVVSAADRSLAAGSFHNAKEAAADSSLRRAAWSGVTAAEQAERPKSVA